MSSSRLAPASTAEQIIIEMPDTLVGIDYADMEAVPLISGDDADISDAAAGELYRNISTDGETVQPNRNWLEEYLDIRPTADAPNTSLTKLQIAILVARFMIGSNTSNMSPPATLPQPFASGVDWGMSNFGVEFGAAAYKAASRYWLDTLNILRNEGGGNAALGLLTGSLKVLVANLPSTLIGIGVGALLDHYKTELSFIPVLRHLNNPAVTRIIAALISPWIYVGMKKFIDYYFPPHNYQPNTTPPIHPLQKLAMLGFNIFDAVTMSELIRHFIKNFASEDIVKHPHFGLIVIGVFILLSNVLDPIAFGHNPLYDPPPFSVPVTNAELGLQPPPAPVILNSDNDDIFVDLDVEIQAEAAAAEQAAVRNAHLANGAVYAACATLAIGAGLLADLVTVKVMGNPASHDNLSRKLGVAFICGTTAATQILLNNGASTIIEKSKQCWASLFHRQEEPVREENPLFEPDVLLSNSL